MLDSQGFDIWAHDYDKEVHASDEKSTYPFTGYKDLINSIYNEVMQSKDADILDIGIGTGTLATKLYEQGHSITGLDFSQKMLDICKEKMPEAEFIKYDFHNELPQELKGKKYDFIISTYAIHHIKDTEKASLIMELLTYVKDDGKIIIGDVSFESKEALLKCQSESDESWDSDEHYFIYPHMVKLLQNNIHMHYIPFSYCSGIMVIQRKS